MEFIKKEDAVRFENSPVCIATEYKFSGEEDMNIASITLDGRYPEKGHALNTVSKELVYIKSGQGMLATITRRVHLSTGDVVLIQPNEQYYFEGTLELIISSSPTWHPEQYRNIL
jgi:mannose-6-phosphate isomerase-like protein (cupin superfamily)